MAIYDSLGVRRGSYTYDAWGRITSLNNYCAQRIADWNPWRWRGYYYDQETGFYYLQSRFYDPQTGRFINADYARMLYVNAALPFGANLFAYCSNNPVMFRDDTGYSILLFGLIVLGFFALSAFALATDGNSIFNFSSTGVSDNLFFEILFWTGVALAVVSFALLTGGVALGLIGAKLAVKATFAVKAAKIISISGAIYKASGLAGVASIVPLGLGAALTGRGVVNVNFENKVQLFFERYFSANSSGATRFYII